MKSKPNYAQLATLLRAQVNCQVSGNTDWFEKHGEHINTIMATAPSGAGIDDGVTLDPLSTDLRLVFTFGFHHMNQDGYYDGWTNHQALVVGDLAHGYRLDITGEDRDGINDYLADVFHQWLGEDAPNA